MRRRIVGLVAVGPVVVQLDHMVTPASNFSLFLSEITPFTWGKAEIDTHYSMQ